MVIDTAEEPRTVWNCGRPDCQSPGTPCLISPRNFAEIKHLSTVLRSRSPPWCQSSPRALVYLKDSLQKAVDVLRKLDVKLKTLEARYAGSFTGAVGIMLAEPFIADTTDDISPVRHQRATITSQHGDNIILARQSTDEEFYEGPMGITLPIEHKNIFAPLRKLKTRVEYCKVRGDLQPST
ncbi:hypothetical protein E6O75_ATG05120 [Venturia nashicola]|uniref:Uncharacterized protein n=1 Tax=Venturia nashicola TaxID=86259 RepID=A0A4Z1PFN7_9PEZI|nr:hypothetical protein E6O75_ATG05120 [Venturia nashicola]